MRPINSQINKQKTKTLEAEFNEKVRVHRASQQVSNEGLESSDLIVALRAAQTLMKQIEPKKRIDAKSQAIEKLRKQAHSMQSVKQNQLNSNFLPKLSADNKVGHVIDRSFQLKQKSFMTPQTDKKFEEEECRRLSQRKWQSRLENVWSKNKKQKLQFPDLDSNQTSMIN